MPYASSPNNSFDQYTLREPQFPALQCKFRLKYDYRQQSTQFIDKMYKQYHNILMINLEHHIQHNKNTQFLKRYYKTEQFPFKIQSLAQYYKFHKQLPRFFQLQLHSILQTYQQQCRNQECQRVSKKIQEQQIQSKCLKQTIQTKKYTKKNAEKIIKNIQLSYLNFQNKNQSKIRSTSKSLTQKLKFHHHIKKPQKVKEKQHKVQKKLNNIKKKFECNKELNDALAVLKSKRSSTKSFNLNDHHLLKKHNNQKAKDQKCSKKNSANTSLNSAKNNLSRSKSKSNLHTYKSSKLLLTKEQINQKRVPLGQKNIQTNFDNLNYQTIRKKFGNVGSSLKKSESSSHLHKKIQSIKSVKVCQFELKKNSTTKQKKLSSIQKINIERKLSKDPKQSKVMSRKGSQTNVKTMFNKVLNTKKRA